MKLLYFLGNIGEDYEKTRHNAGFIVLNKYLELKEIRANFKNEPKLNAQSLKNDYSLFIKPTKYMNTSGQTLKLVSDYFRIPESDILIVQDDIDQTVGNFKIVKNGGSGGHKGIENIINIFEHSNFFRIKIGVAPVTYDPKKDKAEDFVLKNFTTQELTTIHKLVEDKICSIIDEFVQSKV